MWLAEPAPTTPSPSPVWTGPCSTPSRRCTSWLRPARAHAGLDTDTPAGRMVVHVMSALSEWEREMIRTCARAGLAHARAPDAYAASPPPAKTPCARSLRTAV
ncbi:MAG: recombinase family protein [Actinomycetota bacterium]